MIYILLSGVTKPNVKNASSCHMLPLRHRSNEIRQVFRAAMKPMRLKAAFGDTDPTPNGPTLDHADSFINLSSTRLPR